jgi:hypothetical protein
MLRTIIPYWSRILGEPLQSLGVVITSLAADCLGGDYFLLFCFVLSASCIFDGLLNIMYYRG